MTKVFVHGNPETAAVWDAVVAELGRRGVRDVVRLSPPGFGSPVPAGFGATAEEYRGWLAGELRAIGGRIDLVGHDWGAGHVFGVLAHHPGLVRSWAADCAGLLHGNYEWHDTARAWQTPDVGEQMVEALVVMADDEFVALFGALGMGDEVAAAVKKSIDGDMARCILSLYRSASQPYMSELGKAFAAARPPDGMVIVAENDHYAGTDAMASEVALGVGASVARVAGCGHWWMIEDPVAAADALMGHWNN